MRLAIIVSFSFLLFFSPFHCTPARVMSARHASNDMLSQSRSRPRFQITLRRLACLGYTLLVFFLVFLCLVAAYPISFFLEPSPFKSIYFKCDSFKEPHKAIKPLFDKDTEFNVHATLWKDWTGVPSARRIEEMGGKSFGGDEEEEEAEFSCSDREECWSKQFR